ncbi:NAD(+) synthase [Adhaeretor mobilis]|uniref:Glutamine-dependent NAD(+) synthetase n=1 Tax=Adhaeretor mobilis TaxID=1930276 RepID=A0A517MWM9_9BACT|nr:NAD(+) synthase [Adhaeretor mobilis]QDS99217.1 Glutamine-dependent NAD(+) synthetase [Adhaeretor mobilis]
MKLIRVAAAALNQTPLDWDNNTSNIRAVIHTARLRGVSVLCLPELSITGYGCEDAFFSHAVQQSALDVLQEIAPLTTGLAVAVGLPLLHAGALYNTSALLVDGQLKGFAAKQRLAGDGLHYEPRWFKAWPADTVASIAIDGEKYAIGDLLFDVGGIRIGFEICEDAWVAERPAKDHAKLAADIILNPSASHFAFDKAAVRQRLVIEASRAFGVTYVYSNLIGNEAGRIIYDGQTLIGTHGELVARGSRFSFQPVTVCDAVVDIDATRMRRVQSSSYEPQIDVDQNRVVDVSYTLEAADPEAANLDSNTWEQSNCLQEEEFTRAIALGLYDYLRKSHSNGFVVSLSGGADSAAVTCLVALMVKIGCEEVGIGAFAGNTALSNQNAPTQEALVHQWLTTVYQATKNSSKTTKNAARILAEAVSAHHYELDVEDITESYTKKIEEALSRELTWEQDDITLQNIQARVRGPGAWMLANINNALLLATSNRSEAAVGYATMDGDTCGGISPIAGIDKAFLRKWLQWVEREGPQGIGPIPELAAVNQLQPTAELRPQEAGQIDEEDLMPYELLDAIEHQAIGEKRSPQEVLTAVSAEFDQYTSEQLVVWVRRFFQLWSRNQWKRERYAPSFHVDDKNLDPKTWCRFPILSGGFQRELANLESPK